MSHQLSKAEFYAQLEQMGEPLVRERLALSHFGDNGGKRSLVLLWLEEKDQERINASSLENLRVAKSAKNAAWAAALAAIVAAMAAIVAYLAPLAA